MPLTTNVTVEVVSERTGAEVTNTQILRAQAIVDAYTQRTAADEALDLSARDVDNIHAAVAWQAAWMIRQPGLAGRSSMKSIDQDGDRGQFVDERAVVLAPLAKRHIRMLSWKRAGSIKLTPQGATRLHEFLRNPDLWLAGDAEDSGGIIWEPL